MIIRNKKEFIKLIKSFNIKTKFIVIKPNWIDIKKGNYTEPEILEWLFEALPQKKIVIESYTPWRGKEYQEGELGVNLEDGKKFWDFYKEMDKEYLKKTGIGTVLKRFNVSYINITNEYWAKRIIKSSIIKRLVENKYEKLYWTEFYSFVPEKLYKIREDATLISLAKIKIEEENKEIMVSLSSKNIFGLIPHPSRQEPYHRDNHSLIPQAILDINKVYMSVFEKNLWINEGIKSMVKHYCQDNQSYEKNKGIVFIGDNPAKTDIETCKDMGIKPESVPYLVLFKNEFCRHFFNK
ncbi:DUF362 domain-containing protein [Patescibacteria group bacterium]|nr:DUF362 domain-containing protein [Patescibacteria group bacterium]